MVRSIPREYPRNGRFSSSSNCQASYVAQIRKWIDACNLLHGDICVSKPIIEQPYDDVPLWLIDTREQCIVYGVSAHRYLALSYTWPETRYYPASVSRSLILDATTVAYLKTPQCLSGAAIAGTLPHVIQHAMRVTVALGERYLWVDRLCIIQNDRTTQDEVAKMDKIYVGAYMTIIAAASDDMYKDGQLSEWPRFNTLYAPSCNSSSSSQTTKDNVVRIMDLRYGVLSKSRWATRGWTYQEQILCKRAVIFTKEGILWDCQCCMWDGVVLHPGQDIQAGSIGADMGKRFSIRWWPDFGFYIDLICPYNSRKFTYPQDGLSGISGILNALSRSFPGRFVSGIPSMFLDYVLLWQPFEIAVRRMDRDKRSGKYENVSSLPSWAWCGWGCFVDPLSLRSGLAYINEQESRERARSWRTRNLVEWRMSNDQVRSDPLIEPTIFDQYVELSGSPSALLPEGWRSYETLGADPVLCTHATDRKLYFRHPIPLKLNSSRRSKLCIASHLVFNTKAAKFLPAAVLRPEPEDLRQSDRCRSSVKVSVFASCMFGLGPERDKVCPVLVLQQSNGMFAGLLRLMSHDRVDTSRSVELVAISTGSAKAKDLKTSFEWSVFAEGEANNIAFEPSRTTAKQKRALLFDLTMAFDQRAAKEGSLAPELEAIMVKMDSHVKSKMMESHDEFYDPFYYNRFHDLESYEQHVWYKSRAKVLEQHRNSASDLPQTADDAVCHFYNVLWIQRKDGIAYRKACGWVPKYIWEAHAKGPVTITLG